MKSLSLNSPPSEAIAYFSLAAPLISNYIDAENDREAFWAKIVEFIFEYLNEKVDLTADPNIFLEILDKNRKLLVLEDTATCILFIERLYTIPLSDFLLVKFPKATGNPLITINTLLTLCSMKHPLFMRFAGERGAIERLFDTYLPICTSFIGSIDNEHITFRLMISNLMCHVIEKYYEKIVLVEQLILSFRNKLIRMACEAPLMESVPFFRLLIWLDRSTIHKARQEIATKRLVALLNGAPSGHPCHAMVFRFIFKESFEYFKYPTLLQTVFQQGVFSTWDIESIASLIRTSDTDSCLMVIKYLSKEMCLSAVLSRMAAVLLSNNLQKVIVSVSLENWFVELFSKIRVMILLAERKGKYLNRSKRLLEIMKSGIFDNILSIKNQIDIILSKLNDFDDEVESYRTLIPNLKYFPFISNGLSLFEIETKYNSVKTKKKQKRSMSVPKKSQEKKNPAANHESDDD